MLFDGDEVDAAGRSHTGAWIEIVCPSYGLVWPPVAPIRERGLKSGLYELHVYFVNSACAVGGGDVLLDSGVLVL